MDQRFVTGKQFSMLFHGRGDPCAPCVHHWHHEKGLGTAEIDIR